MRGLGDWGTGRLGEISFNPKSKIQNSPIPQNPN
jgi:hypothetical protein